MTHWIGIDGEGLGRTPHRYVMLARADTNGHSDVIESRKGLSTTQCLNFLLDTPQKTRVCGYYLSYDWTMILRDLPNELIYRLLRPELRKLPGGPDGEGGGFSNIHWNGFRLHFLAGMLRIKDRRRDVTIWDLGKFYQSTFVEAIKAWEVIAPLTDIVSMKEKRSTFSWSQREQIRSYCISECRALSELASRLERAHQDVGIRPTSWHGPGSTASALMKTLTIKEKLGDQPSGVLEAADRAFFGGRFEHSMIGKRERVYGYDIVSAYPYEAFRLPCLLHGKWRKIKNERYLSKGAHACVCFELTDIGEDQAWGPLPVRLPNGTIVYPRAGVSGWAWLDEYLTASREWRGVKFKEAWVLYKECECQPFAELLELFRARILLGKTGKGRITKLALNSVYGKLAQTVGAPQFASRVWAGMVTSGTRAQLLRLLCRNVDRRSVLALATDGLYSTENVNLPQAPLFPDTLGAWEQDSQPKDMTFVRPGIYWSEDDTTVRARGIGRKQLVQREAVIDAIEADDPLVEVGTSDLFGGARACIYRLRNGTVRRSKHYGQWHSIPARVSLDPGPKRTHSFGLHVFHGIESMPYTRAPKSDDAVMLETIGDVFEGMRG